MQSKSMVVQESVPLAVQFVENEIRRLLEGGCELSEMVMTGGLWRITGNYQSAWPIKGISFW